MKAKYHLLPIILPLLFVACAHAPAIGEYQRLLQEHGFVAYKEPIGDPHNRTDWGKYGPGTILRTKSQDYVYAASSLIGNQGVQDAMDPKNSSPISLFTGKRVSGYDIDGHGGWSISAVSEISGAAQLHGATDVDLQFGNAWKANPRSERELHESLRHTAADMNDGERRAIRNGQFAVVQTAVFTDSVRYYFKQTRQNGASAAYKLSAQEIANLQGKGYSVINGGVEVKQARFIAFTPLPEAGKDVERKP